MEKQDIIEKLAELGIISTNCYPKSSYIRDADVHIGVFKNEMQEDFYFFNKFDKKIYKFPKPENIDKYEREEFKGMVKYQIPIHECQLIWEDKEFVDLPDLPFRDMSLRHYACIHLRVANSGLDWLDNIINSSKYE